MTGANSLPFFSVSKRREQDSNLRRVAPNTLSKRAPSTTRPSLRSKTDFEKLAHSKIKTFYISAEPQTKNWVKFLPGLLLQPAEYSHLLAFSPRCDVFYFL
jgi:hypothetical protein